MNAQEWLKSSDLNSLQTLYQLYGGGRLEGTETSQAPMGALKFPNVAHFVATSPKFSFTILRSEAALLQRLRRSHYSFDSVRRYTKQGASRTKLVSRTACL